MARCGFGDEWACRFANDFCQKKAESYVANHGADHFHPGCISDVRSSDLPGRSDVAWASFPCQDLSLAGNRGGLAAKRSGTFWPFWELMKSLAQERRPPRLIAMENVTGLLSSGSGQDFATLVHALALEGYTTGALVIDASLFVPQSRKRVFVVAYAPGERVPDELMSEVPDDFWHPGSMRRSVAVFSPLARRHWFWLAPPHPPTCRLGLREILESPPVGVEWHSAEQTDALLQMMSPVNRKKIETVRAAGNFMVGCLYKRTRPGPDGRKVQRAEVRFDLAGCLRTPGGGSSRQTLVVAQDGELRTRLISPREGARLMGLPDSYVLPDNYNDAYHLVGDGVVVPAVEFLRKCVLEPILTSDRPVAIDAA